MKNILSQSDINHIEELCSKYNIKDYKINNDGSIDVNGRVTMMSIEITKLPLKFNIVSGDFWIQYNKLTSLEGAPTTVGGYFCCSENKLTSLKGAPEKVIGIACSDNKLSTLEGCPIITTDEKCYFSENEFPNPVIMKLFKLNDNEKLNIFIKYQNHFDVWVGENGFNLEGFNDLMDEITEGLR